MKACDQVVEGHRLVSGLFKVNFDWNDLVVVRAEQQQLLVGTQGHVGNLVKNNVDWKLAFDLLITALIIILQNQVVFIDLGTSVRHSDIITF